MCKFKKFDKVTCDWGNGRIMRSHDLSRYGAENTYEVRLDRRPYGHLLRIKESGIKLVG